MSHQKVEGMAKKGKQGSHLPHYSSIKIQCDERVALPG